MTHQLVARFTIPIPQSKKNNARIFKNRRTGRLRVSKSDEIRNQEDAIATLAGVAMRGAQLVATSDVRVEIDYRIQARTCEVRVYELDAPPKKGRTGRDRDIANLPESVLDAMQGVVYTNDNQVAELLVRRMHC